MKKKNPLYVDRIYDFEKVIKSSDFDEGKWGIKETSYRNVSYFSNHPIVGNDDFYTQGFRLCRTTKKK